MNEEKRKPEEKEHLSLLIWHGGLTRTIPMKRCERHKWRGPVEDGCPTCWQWVLVGRIFLGVIALDVLEWAFLALRWWFKH